MDLQSDAEQSLEGNPFDKVVEIYEARMKQVLEESKPNPFQLNERELQAQAERQYNVFLEQYVQLDREEKENGKILLNQQSNQSDQRSRQLQEFQYRCFLKKLKAQCNKQRLHIPSIKDSLFCQEDFMKKHKINFAKARRLQKEISNLILLNYFQFKAMPINDQQLDQNEKKLKEDLTNFYEKEINNVKKYFPEDYQHIFALATARGPMSVKKRKQKSQK